MGCVYVRCDLLIYTCCCRNPMALCCQPTGRTLAKRRQSAPLLRAWKQRSKDLCAESCRWHAELKAWHAQGDILASCSRLTSEVSHVQATAAYCLFLVCLTFDMCVLDAHCSHKQRMASLPMYDLQVWQGISKSSVNTSSNAEMIP